MTDTHNQPNDSTGSKYGVAQSLGVWFKPVSWQIVGEIPTSSDERQRLVDFPYSSLEALLAQARIQGAEELAERSKDTAYKGDDEPEHWSRVRVEDINASLAAYKSELTEDGDK